MSQKIIAILQARMSSSRLPGKVLQELGSKPILQHMIERARRTRWIEDVLVATTIDPSDDVLEQFCQAHGVRCFRGSLPDVLDRFYQAALLDKADVVVRLTGDCPLIDPEVTERTLLTFLGQSQPADLQSSAQKSARSGHCFDFAANRLPPPWKRSLPIGLDVEVCSFDALASAWRDAHQPYQREHVLPYLYEGITFPPASPPVGTEWYVEQGHTPRGFRVALLNHLPDYGALRLTVDTPADLELLRHVYSRLGGEDFTWLDVVHLLESSPELLAINAQIKHKTAFDVDHRTAKH